MKSKFLIQLLFLISASCVSLIAQSSGETEAQRRLREDRERFSRQVERQAAEARAREDQARASASEQRTREDMERLRIQQSKQGAEAQRLEQRLRESTPVLPPTSVRTTTAPVSSPPLPAGGIVPDFSVSFLADGNCVVYVKGRAPEVHSLADAENILSELVRTKRPASVSERK